VRVQMNVTEAHSGRELRKEREGLGEEGSKREGQGQRWGCAGRRKRSKEGHGVHSLIGEAKERVEGGRGSHACVGRRGRGGGADVVLGSMSKSTIVESE